MNTLPDITCPMPSNYPPITAIVVSRNEGHHLEACLQRLRFCEQIILVNMESTDNTLEIACRYADKIISHPVSPFVEPVRVAAVKHVTTNWILLVDPDEHYPQELIPWIRQATLSDAPGGMYDLPMSYYFKGKLLTSTIWGQRTQVRPALVNLERCTLRPWIMCGPQLHDGYERLPVTPTQTNHIRHYWTDGYTSLIEAMWRYVKQEGKTRFERGERVSCKRLIRDPLFQFKANMLYRNGIHDGMRGLSLSVIYSAYLFGSAVSLALYQLKQKFRKAPVAPLATESDAAQNTDFKQNKAA
jgi:glycosyltransferase involved in cell wall biosynthesis